jgi:hypothetical protein
MKKILFIGLMTASFFSFAQTPKALKLDCTSADNAQFVMDQFDNDPCRIQKIANGKSELVTNVSVCIFPDEVHSDFSFWYIDPARSTSYFQGSLEQIEDKVYAGKVSLDTATSTAILTLRCEVI